SDMDLALLSPLSEPPPSSPESLIPRVIEKKLLDLGFGARLLTKTRVPIIKLCEMPTEDLLKRLLQERDKWENPNHAKTTVLTENKLLPNEVAETSQLVEAFQDVSIDTNGTLQHAGEGLQPRSLKQKHGQ